MGKELCSLSPVHRCQETVTEMSQCKATFWPGKMVFCSPVFWKLVKEVVAKPWSDQEELLGEWGGSFTDKLLRVSALSVEKFDLRLQGVTVLFFCYVIIGSQQVYKNLSQNWRAAQTFPTVQFPKQSNITEKKKKKSIISLRFLCRPCQNIWIHDIFITAYHKHLGIWRLRFWNSSIVKI